VTAAACSAGAVASGSSPPWIAISSTTLFFVADDAVGATNVTAQLDRAGGSTLTDGGSPFLTRQGGGRRYGASAVAGAGLSRTGAAAASLVLYGSPIGSAIDGLGTYNNAGAQHSDMRLYVTSTHVILKGLRHGSGDVTRSFAHGGIVDGTYYCFGASPSTSFGTDFYLNGVFLGQSLTPGESITPTGLDLRTHIGARSYTTGGAGTSTDARGAFVAGMLASGVVTASEHLAVYQWFLANAPV
jgi:hypothetical protein